MAPAPMLMPSVAMCVISPSMPLAKFFWLLSNETPPSSSTRPAPIVSGSSVTSGRCCACTLVVMPSNRADKMKYRIVISMNRPPGSPSPPAVEKNRDRAVVGQLHFHMRLELACFHFQIQFAKLTDQG